MTKLKNNDRLARLSQPVFLCGFDALVKSSAYCRMWRNVADIDMDGDVDFEDIPLFIELLTGGSVNAQAGLPGLAMGADGLRARRMAATA